MKDPAPSAPARSGEKRSSSLGAKLIGATMVVLALVATLVYYRLSAYERANVLAAKEKAALMVARLFAANVSAPLTFGDDKGVSESVATLATNEDVGYGAAWSAENGRVVALLGELRRTDAAFAPPTTVPLALGATRSTDWVLVDGPVTDPTGKVVGVSRVAFSLARENEEIAAMERKALWLSLATALSVGLVLVVLSRALIVRPLSRLSAAARKLESGERVEVHVDSNDEIGQLAAAFATMSDAIAAREKRIGERNRDMRLVLDNVEDGFISVDRDGRMSDERSRVLDIWFGPPQAGETLFEYMDRFAPKAAQWLKLGLETIVEDVFPIEVALDQLPKRFARDDRHFELRYRPLSSGEAFTGMLVVISDVTPRVERERADAGQREMLAAFRRMLADRHAFGEFLEECGSLVEAIAQFEGGDVVTLRRQIHTLKGNTSLFGVESVARVCHELETRMLEGDEQPSSAELQAIRDLWKALLDRCTELGWNAHAGVVQLEIGELHELAAAVHQGADRRELTQIIASWQLEPAAARLARIGEQITALAGRLGKPKPAIEIAPTRLRLPPRKWAPFLTSLAHVVRNVVDHGLETEDERKASGKPTPSVVRLSIEAGRGVAGPDEAGSGDGVTLSIADDGRGIPWEKIRERARVRGLPSTTPADLEEALFAEDVSSVESATQTSGRGIGMCAVRAAAHACGGTVRVESTPGAGTTFRFLFPSAMLEPDDSPVVGDPPRTSRPARPRTATEVPS